MRRVAFACFDNGLALLAEATLLFEHGHFARAGGLAALGMQEVAKTQVCLGLLNGVSRYDNLRDQQKFWDLWAHHERKGDHAFSTDPDSSAIRRYVGSSLGPRAGTNLEKFRLLCFYVDVREPPTPIDIVKPMERVHHTHTASLMMTLREFIKDVTPMMEVLGEVHAKNNERFAAEFKRIWDERFPDDPIQIKGPS
jgi:AbiV family abortive infection protein